LQELFKDIDRQLKAKFDTEYNRKLSNKYGASTTHLGKLIPRIAGGRGGGCPILAFGIKRSLYVEDINDEEAKRLILAESSNVETEEAPEEL
jgi:hypothetical protein